MWPAFLASCRTLRFRDAWRAACTRAGDLDTPSSDQIRAYLEDRPKPPEWLTIDVTGNELAAKIQRLPERRDINLPLNEQLIVEYYSR